jgi:DNA polymerase-1
MLIDRLEDFERVIPDMLKCMNPVVDTETNGLNIWGTRDSERSHIIGIAVDTEREAYYFPYRHAVGQNLPEETLEFFRWFLSNPDRVYGGFNYKFDMHMLFNEGVPYAMNIEDGMLSAHLLNENEPNFELKDTCDRYEIGDGSLQESILRDKVVEACNNMGITVSIAKRSKDNWKGKMWVLPASDIEPYACDDVRLTRALIEMHRPALQYWNLLEMWKQINHYSVITAKMERSGMQLDLDLINKYMSEASGEADTVMARLNEAAGYAINVNSSKQVCALLEVDSSAAEVLDILSERGGKTGEIAELVKLARGWRSVESRYYTPYKSLCDQFGVLRTNLNLHGTISGRLSSNNPNLQAVARHTDVFKVKDVFISRPGCTMVVMDYKQAEMRLASYYAKEENMADLIRKGEDIHSSTAAKLGIPRDAAKRINFGVIYGIGAESLSETLRIPKKTASEYLKLYHGLYPGFRQLMDACESYADNHEFIKMWTGRMRHYDGNNPTHKAMSNLIQGGVAEIMRVTIMKVSPIIRDLGGNMLLQVHDSLIFEIPDDNLMIGIPVVKETMEDLPFDPAMVVDVAYGKRWGDMKAWTSQ